MSFWKISPEDRDEHHIYNKDGTLKGVGIIDTSRFTHQELWERIDECIREYTKLHPREMAGVVKANNIIARNQWSETAKTRDGSMRWGANVPIGLMLKLEEIEPRLFGNKKLFLKFLNKYKGLRVCEKV